MATHIYKCPNCDAELTYRPDGGDFACAYCGSHYTAAELEKLDTAKQADAKQEQDAHAKPGAELNVYNCPSCGAEIVADATTAATFCFYCHSPVILTGKLAGAYKPDRVIPFAIDKKEVTKRLLDWCRKKKYIDPAFFDASQMEKLSGVYFPFWVVDSTVDASLTAKGTQLRVWNAGTTEYTETSVYDLSRGGTLDFPDVTVKALSREDVKLLDGIYPYDMKDLKPFDMAYLSGFYAEKRDVEKAAVTPEVTQTVRTSAQTLLEDEISGYGSISDLHCDTKIAKQDWHYSLLPAWMLTYRYGDKTYYFAMNAQTGKIAGQVPLSNAKLNGLFAWVAAGVCLAMLLVRWLLW